MSRTSLFLILTLLSSPVWAKDVHIWFSSQEALENTHQCAWRLVLSSDPNNSIIPAQDNGYTAFNENPEDNANRWTFVQLASDACTTTIPMLPSGQAPSDPNNGYWIPLTACVGGTNDGLHCFVDTDCDVGGTCEDVDEQCAGGTRDGLNCELTADCTGGGTCVPWNFNNISFVLEGRCEDGDGWSGGIWPSSSTCGSGECQNITFP